MHLNQLPYCEHYFFSVKGAGMMYAIVMVQSSVIQNSASKSPIVRIVGKR